MKRLLTTIAVIVLFGNAAYAGDTYILPDTSSAEYGSYKLKNVDVMQHPFDYSRLNESPIQGKGRISVVHNEPAPDDPDRKLTEALWLLQDNSWTCYKPRQTRRR